ncbi:hypothetical protein AAMO2058_000885000 [Amorphochlora amoebiformis]
MEKDILGHLASFGDAKAAKTWLGGLSLENVDGLLTDLKELLSVRNIMGDIKSKREDLEGTPVETYRTRSLEMYTPAVKSLDDLENDENFEDINDAFSPSAIIQSPDDNVPVTEYRVPSEIKAKPRCVTLLRDAKASVSGVISKEEKKECHELAVDILDMLVSPNFGTDWNSMYQTAWEKQDLNKMWQIAYDFEAIATTYGKVILQELYLPPNQRTIKQITRKLGGIAGGQKYIARGILFKLVKDSGLYGEATDYDTKFTRGEGNMKRFFRPRMDIAAKVSGAELRALNAYEAAFKETAKRDMNRIRLPLQVMVDYAGHRIVCMPLLPIDKETLIYGGDSGNVKSGDVNKKEKCIKAQVDEASERLHLATHIFNEVKLSVAWDVEIHLGHDGRAYMLDLGRAIPPQFDKLLKTGIDSKGKLEDIEVKKDAYMTPKLPGTVKISKKGQAALDDGKWCERSLWLTRLFRPEFISRIRSKFRRLNPDTFHSTMFSHHRKTLLQATRYLLHDWIPAFGRMVDENKISYGDGYLTTDSTQRLRTCKRRQYLKQEEIPLVLHFYGINIQYVGLLRSHIQRNRAWRDHLLIEGFARAVKHHIRYSQRQILQKCGATPSDFELNSGATQILARFWDGIDRRLFSR